MLTADLVRARRRGGELQLVALAGATRERAVGLADAFLGRAREHVGHTRGELHDALAAVLVEPRDKRLADGLRKLLDDACEFAAESGAEAAEIRDCLFRRAAQVRSGLASGDRFDRDAVLEEVARERGSSPQHLEARLYADLRSAHVLGALEDLSGEKLVERYERAQVQAILLRAVKVTVSVSCAAASAYRALFHRLKFRRLLYQVESVEAGGYRITIDGPYSLFESVTRYGLQLAMIVPALAACDSYQLEADILWGKRRQPLVFRATGGGAGALDGDAEASEEVLALSAAFGKRPGPWRVSRAAKILDLRGVGLCVPDLEFRHEGGACVYLEALGYWSREAVWRRVELVEKGLPESVLFAVSRRLRVSEEVLDEKTASALYVYRTRMSRAEVEERLEALRSRQASQKGGRRPPGLKG